MSLSVYSYVSLVDTDDGAVFLDERRGKYFQVNSIGAEMVRLLVDGLSCEDVVRKISGKYSVDKCRVREDMAQLVTSLRNAGLAA